MRLRDCALGPYPSVRTIALAPQVLLGLGLVTSKVSLQQESPAREANVLKEIKRIRIRIRINKKKIY